MATLASHFADRSMDPSLSRIHPLPTLAGSHPRVRPQSHSPTSSQLTDDANDTFFEAEQDFDLAESSSSLRSRPQRSMTSPMAFEEDSYTPAEEYVVALHDFTSTNSTCLSFVAGQVIKVFNRDSSGWWDGELDGQRGWFPSNYVDQEGAFLGDGAEADEADGYYGHAENDSFPSHDHNSRSEFMGYSSGSSVGGLSRYYSSNPASRSPTPTSAMWADRGNAGVLDPILHAIALLHNAVRANRVAHFQPSTACVISSVRSVLSATDCLTRESPILKAHPTLAKERKAILSELSRLVNQARKASAPMVDETLRDQEMDAMLNMAQLVLTNVRRFLQVAIECDVPVPDRRSSVYDDLYNDRSRPSNGTSSRPSVDRSELDKTPTPDSPRVPSRAVLSGSISTNSPRNAKSYVDLRRSNFMSRRTGSDPHSDESHDIDAEAIANARSLSHDRLVKGQQLTRSHSDSSSDSPESNSGCETSSQSGSTESIVEPITPGPVERTPQEVMQRLSLANDQLLSIIAAFIGHVHTHTAESHASSYAHLIDMTREAVDGVRNLLLVVEAVNNNVLLQAERPREMSILWETRESLYEATTALVTAARVITSAPSANNPSRAASEAEDKSRLLQAATGVLRTGGECVGAVRLCIDKLDKSLTITLAEPSRAQPYPPMKPNRTSKPDDEDAALVNQGATGVGIRRGKHTLSFLGRKATSLSCLKEKYERDGYVNEFDNIDEDELDFEEVDGVSASGSLGDGSTVMQGPAASPRTLRNESTSMGSLSTSGSHGTVQATRSGHHDDSNDSSSEPMSRDHSRASGSTTRSAHTDFTGDTSARPSLDATAEGLPALAGSGTLSRDGPRAGNLLRRASEAPPRHDSRLAGPGLPNTPVKDQTPMGRARAGTLDSRLMHPSALHASVVEATFMGPDYDATDVVYNSEGQVTGATLCALIEKMTPHDTTIDATFSTAFFLCFRMFTSPMELLEGMIARYNLQPPAGVQLSPSELSRWNDSKVTPVRLRVLNFLKSWLENHWHDATDRPILERLIAFTKQTVCGPLAKAAQRLGELGSKRLSDGAQKTVVLVGNQRGPGSLQRVVSSERLKSGVPMGLAMTDASQMYAPSAFSKGGPMPPTSIVSKTLLSNLRVENFEKINIVDFDPLELARQLTIIDSKLYCAIQPEELLGSKFSKKSHSGSASEDVHVKSMSAMSTRITGWISECILGEVDARKRTQLLKFFIKVGDRCESLNNFHTLMAIQCALNSSTIARLKKTWDGLPQKYRVMMDQQRRAIEHTRNYAGYRARLRGTFPPAVPFLGLFLTDLTFCHEGNAATRPCPSAPEKKLLNFDKYVKISRIVSEMQRFQVPFNLVEVPEMQSFLKAALDDVRAGNGGLGADDLYRRSLLLEPRSGDGGSSQSHGNASSAGSIAMRSGGGGDSKIGLDIFNWRTDKA